MNNPFRIKALVVYDGIDEENATARALRALKQDLEESDVEVEVSQCICDAELIVTSDPSVQCVLVYLTVPTTKNIAAFSIFWNFCAAVTTICPCF